LRVAVEGLPSPAFLRCVTSNIRKDGSALLSTKDIIPSSSFLSLSLSCHLSLAASILLRLCLLAAFSVIVSAGCHHSPTAFYNCSDDEHVSLPDMDSKASTPSSTSRGLPDDSVFTYSYKWVSQGPESANVSHAAYIAIAYAAYLPNGTFYRQIAREGFMYEEHEDEGFAYSIADDHLTGTLTASCESRLVIVGLLNRLPNSECLRSSVISSCGLLVTVPPRYSLRAKLQIRPGTDLRRLFQYGRRPSRPYERIYVLPVGSHVRHCRGREFEVHLEQRNHARSHLCLHSLFDVPSPPSIATIIWYQALGSESIGPFPFRFAPWLYFMAHILNGCCRG
jgi:hypothetical protein